MSIIKIENPMTAEVLIMLKKTDISQYEIYSAVKHATTTLAGEVAKTADYIKVNVNTYYGSNTTKSLNENMIIVSRIRSGLPMIESLREYFKCGKISYILLDKESDSKVLYSSVGSISKFEKVIYVEPFVMDITPVEVTMQHLFSKGALQKNISIVILAASKRITDELDRNYPNASIFLGQEDIFFENYLTNDRYYDDISGIIFGDNEKYNEMRIKYFGLWVYVEGFSNALESCVLGLEWNNNKWPLL